MTMNSAADLSAATRPLFGATPRSPELDASRYMEAVKDLDLTEAQKVELLTALWGMMRMFVQLGVRTEVSTAILSGAGLLLPDEEGSE